MEKEFNFEPNGAWTVAERPDAKVKGGIILDDETRRSLQTNIVQLIAVGPLSNYKVGDTVMVDPRTEAMAHKIDGRECIFILDANIMGKFKD